MKTRAIKHSEIKEKWYLLDAKGKRLGHLATTVSSLLLDKDNPYRDPNLLPKVKVIVINSKKIDIHPRKRRQKNYYFHSGFIGNLKEIPFERMIKKHPNKVISLAVKGMLPANKHKSKILANLMIYEDDKSKKHEAQKPKKIEIDI